jgi:GMP synthase (glutamine-hydrolysing)
MVAENSVAANRGKGDQRNGPVTGKILIIVHQEHSTPGRVGMMLKALGYSLDIRRPCMGCELPKTMAEHEGAVIFGGPMSANDPDDYIKREIDWIGVPLHAGKPFLGVCLGAQMLAKHLGEKVAPHTDELAEIGYCRIRPTPEGAPLGPWPEHVYQWHREGHSLPRGAVRLATGDDFENQAYRYGATAWGIQFHPEVTRQTMHRWVVKGRHRFDLKGAQPGADHLSGQILHDAPVRAWLSSFLDTWRQSAVQNTVKAA